MIPPLVGMDELRLAGVGAWLEFELLTLERVMNLGENRIEMRIPRSACFPRDLRFPHS